MITQTESMEVIEARTLIRVPHLGGKLTFAYPVKGPGNYQEVGGQIDNDKKPSQLYRPTTAETISLIYAAFQDEDNKYSQEIIDIFKSRHFWCFTKNLWTPKGVYVVDDKDGSKLNRKDLEKRLEQKDTSVRFVPNGFKLREQTPKELEANPYVIAHAGEEGAQKLAKIASEFKNNPLVYGLGNVTQDTERVTGVNSDLNGYWLGFYCDCFDGYWNGCAVYGCAVGVQNGN
jgi:hypothetical protein